MKKTDAKLIAAAHAAIEPFKDQLADLHADLQSDFDEKSDRWREGEKGEHAQEVLSALEAVVDDLDSVLDGLATLQSLAESVP